MSSQGGDFKRRLPDSAEFSRPVSLARRLHIDLPLTFMLLAVSGFGLVVLHSASNQSTYYLDRQLTMFVAAYVAYFVVAQVPLGAYRRLAPWLYLAGLMLLAAVAFFGTGAKGAQRWLDLPGLPRFQPSEVMKLIVPLLIAAYLSRAPLPPSPLRVLKAIAMIAVPTLLILVQPDLGTALLIATSGFLVLFLAGLSWKLMGLIVGAIAVSTPALWLYVLRDYQKARILTLLDPQSDKLGAGWNIIQSKTAIGSGGLYGKGWLEGTQSQLDFLPESHTDFIIAVLAEEFGLNGVILLLSLYLLTVGRCLYISLQAQESFSRLLGGALTLTFFVYIFVNMGMVSGLLPVVGIPLPLVSHGGTSLISLMISFGLIMAIATEKRRLIT